MTRHLPFASTLLLAFLISLAPAASAGERPLKGGASKPDVLYHNYCSVCHGDRGDGNSRAKNSLVPPPKDFTRAPELTRDTMITIITHGKPGTAMMGWKTQLEDKEIAALADYIRSTFMQVSLDPKLQRGRVVYAQNCMVCHGERGQGAAGAAGLIPARDFTTPQARVELTRERMINAVTQGRPNTAMAAFANRLPATDIEAVVDYVRAGLMLPSTGGISGTNAHAGRSGEQAGEGMSMPFANGLTGDAARGEKFYMANCATCHGAKGDGKGPRAYFINPKPRNFIDKNFRLAFNRPAIYTAVHDGRLGAEMPAWSKVLSDQEMTDVSEFVFRRFVQGRGASAK
ncbi:c-type cytochrome [Dechloromonas sp. XY25]|uniref:C-type cytochrome n=1 Tax=Dechloromonas hankyongensis TaxID=2908002 RepID=A0ABS9K1X0_9RHOO|nr:cytochrome c [Dechloromonas hankyongensis]MCG2577157.1 c-type cytochrome [Dechloromonas hankyongensis]